MNILQANPDKPWRDLTEEHKKVREGVESRIDSISTGETKDPSAIVGPYRSGKTQLLYHAFQYSWEKGVPALYTDAHTLFREYENASTEIGMSNWLEDRVNDQIDDVYDGTSIDWVPNWRTPSDRKNWEDKVESQQGPERDYYVLLVDEVEQAYTKLRQSDIHPLETDDRNPLRILLDDTEGVCQFWAFGLVSAYEFRGEADAGRFHEFRLPILTPNDIAVKLEESGKNSDLATGIWWLSRGRIGWANKLIDGCPDSIENIDTWVENVSSYNFEATRPLEKMVFDNIEGTDALSEARRAILFLPNDHDDWKVEGEQVVAVGAVTDICVQSICKEDTVYEVREIIERNSRRLAEALAPTSVWIDGDPLLPMKLLLGNEDVAAFLNLLNNLIISFEGRTSSRSKAIELVNNVDENKFQDEWLDRVYDYIEKPEKESVWSIKPSVVGDAYPPVAVNPSRLSSKSSTEIHNNLENGINFKQSPETDHVTTHVSFCPTEETFEEEVNRCISNNDIREISIIFIPEKHRDDWEVTEKFSKFEDYHRLNIAPEGGERLWEFVSQLYQYFEDEGLEQPISSSRIEQAVNTEENRENRNTIKTLYDQTESVITDRVQSSVQNFVSEFSLPQDNVPVWGNESLDSDIPFWSWSGGANIPRVGLSYALVLSEEEFDNNRGFMGLRSDLIGAYDDGYFSSPEKYGFKEFLDLVFGSSGASGFSPQTEDERERYGTSDTKHRSIDRFQKFVWDLTVKDGMSDGMDTSALTKLLLDIRPIDKHDDKINILNNTSFDYDQAPALVWGGLIERGVRLGEIGVEDKLSQIQSTLSSQINKSEKLLNDIQNKNEILSPPEGSRVRIGTSDLEGIYRNLKSANSNIAEINNIYHETEGQGTHILVFYSITRRYADLIGESMIINRILLKSPWGAQKNW